MTRRLLSVNAFTTLDLVAADVETRETAVEVDGVVDVTVEDDRPSRVTLAVELDAVGLDAVPSHADRIRLTPDQARALGEALGEHAAEVEDAGDHGDAIDGGDGRH
ncbi:MAG: DUF6360 family protein [Halorubrum sp.]